jgi:hypothetical protein
MTFQQWTDMVHDYWGVSKVGLYMFFFQNKSVISVDLYGRNPETISDLCRSHSFLSPCSVHPGSTHPCKFTLIVSDIDPRHFEHWISLNHYF